MAEVKRAYGEVVILRRKLNNLLRVLLKIVDIKKMQAELFIEKVVEVIKILEMQGTPCLPDQLVEDIVPLALPIGNFVRGSGLQIVLSNVEYIMTTYYCWRAKSTRELPEIVEQIGLIENKLEKFLDETDFYNVWDDLRNNLVVLLPSREAVRKLLQASQELKQVINFFHEVYTETGVLLDYLSVLLRLKTSHKKCKCSNELMEVIRDMDKALEKINSHQKQDPLISCFVEIEDVWLSCFTKLDAEKMAKKIFDGKNGMRLVLLETIQKLHSFKGEIDMISEKLGREDRGLLQSESYILA